MCKYYFTEKQIFNLSNKSKYCSETEESSKQWFAYHGVQDQCGTLAWLLPVRQTCRNRQCRWELGAIQNMGGVSKRLAIAYLNFSNRNLWNQISRPLKKNSPLIEKQYL